MNKPTPAPPGAHWPLRLDQTSAMDRRAASDALDIDGIRDLLGMLLVDGSFKTYPTPSGGYVQLSLVSGLQAIDYLEAKADVLRRYLPTRAEITTITSKRSNGRSSVQLRLRVSSNRLRPIYNLLYPGGEREITRNALDLLGAKAAAWIWAEGAKLGDDGRLILRRVGATSYEACLIGGWLEVLTGATSSLAEGSRRPRLILEADQAQKAAAVLAPFAPPARQERFAL